MRSSITRRMSLLAFLPALLFLLGWGVSPAVAARGGPDASGYTWLDALDGCPIDIPAYAQPSRHDSPTDPVGPVPLGFSMPYHDEAVTDVWLSPHGFLTFSAEGIQGDGSVTQSLPHPSPPDHLIAPFWIQQQALEIAVESTTGLFHASWTFPAPAVEETIHLLLHRDGSMRIVWGTTSWLLAEATVGYEDRAGTSGVTFYRNEASVEPGFGEPISGSALCIEPPRLLDCSDPVPLRCGLSVASTLPSSPESTAEVYACSDTPYLGNERVFRLDLDHPTSVAVTLEAAPGLDLLWMGSEEGCGEAACVLLAERVLEFPNLFTGSHWFAVDKPDPGGDDPFSVRIDCVEHPAIDCDGSVGSRFEGDPGSVARHLCAPVDLPGGERAFRIRHPVPGHLLALASPPEPWVVLYSPDGECLAAGQGGAVLFEAEAGEYVAVVDSEEAGAQGEFTVDVRCGPTLRCALAEPVECGDRVTGPTTGAASSAFFYGCPSTLMDGAESVYRFVSEVERTVSVHLETDSPERQVFLVSGCDEGNCRARVAGRACLRIPPGEHHLVVDAPAGDASPFTLGLECGAVGTAGPNLAVQSVDLPPRTCNDLTVSGPAFVGIGNIGGRDVAAAFSVEVFVDLDRDRRSSAGDLVLGSVQVTDGLPAGASLRLEVALSGILPLRDSPVLGQVDPEGLIPDGNPFDDVSVEELACSSILQPGAMATVLEWEWSGSTVHPAYVHVHAAPLVGDVDGDGIPDVVFVTQQTESSGAFLRVVSGLDGSEILSAGEEDARLLPYLTPAMADLDGDTRPEFVGAVSDLTRERLVALDGNGSSLWLSDSFPRPGGWGGIALGDLDGDGQPEIVYGNRVFRADGSPFWTAPSDGSQGNNDGSGPLSVMADLDGDGGQEVIAGPTVYAFDPPSPDPRVLWESDLLPDGYLGVADFDGDGDPEVVLVSLATVHLLDGKTGERIWSTRIAERDAGGGAPTIADFDGDGAPEIGYALTTWYTVLDGNGTMLWRQPIVDRSSGYTSAAAFDFDGDGAHEIVHMDEQTLRVFRGSDGEILLSLPNRSSTWQEMPVVADVDADGSAEIVVPRNDTVGGGPAGIRVFGPAGGSWAPARGVWNQHSYHVSNINDDLTVSGSGTTLCEPASWLQHNTYRAQEGGRQLLVAGPDLSLAMLDANLVSSDPCRPQVEVRVRMGNAGTASSEVPAEVWFYAGTEPVHGPVLVAALEPGEWLDLVERFSIPRLGEVEVRAVVDEQGRVAECRPGNNACATTLEFPPPVAPREPSALDLRPGATPLTVARRDTHLHLAWEALGPDQSYDLYSGVLGDFASHGRIICGSDVPTAQLAQEAGSRYFLPVGSVCDGRAESAFGRDSEGRERPAGSPRCP